jgi:two-component system, NarL family, sensor histidine kinase UhpB
MWKRLSLRARLSLPMVAMVLAALVLGGVALQLVSPGQFEYENEQTSRSARIVADALNAALAASNNPKSTLDAFQRTLSSSEVITFRGSDFPQVAPPARLAQASVPKWFIVLLQVPELGATFPISIGQDHVGDIVYMPDLSADIFEKWIGFLAIVASGSSLMLLAAASAYFTSGAAIGPLGRLQTGLSRLRAGDYDTEIPLAGPPEIRRSCDEANELARTLKRLSQDNRNLLRRIVSVQDEERRELARELHDELGPLLFAIRANATALAEAEAGGNTETASFAQGILQAAETLQQANRRILEGLSPLYVGELGLEQSLQTLLRSAQSQAPAIRFATRIDHRLNNIDGLLSQTTYRVIQEGVTNVLRHAQAKAMEVSAAIVGDDVTIEISDDGIGLAPQSGFGRGLTGMYERIRALNGTFELSRENGRTLIRCRLPLEQATGH